MQINGWNNIAEHFKRHPTTVRGWVKNKDGSIKEGCPVFINGRAHCCNPFSLTDWLDENVPAWRMHDTADVSGYEIESRKINRDINAVKKIVTHHAKRQFPNLTTKQAETICKEVSNLFERVTTIKTI